MARGIEAFSSDKQHALVAVARICSVISLIFSSFIVISFVRFPDLRKLSFMLVALLAAADIGASIGYMLGSPADHSAMCITQAVLIQFFPIASWMLAAAIAWVMMQITLSYRLFDAEQSRRFTLQCLVVTGSAAAFFTILPATTESYGGTGSWCWINSKDDWGTIWRYAAFYVPLWIIIAYEVVAYSLIFHRMKKVRSFFDARRRRDHGVMTRSSLDGAGSINSLNHAGGIKGTHNSISMSTGWEDVAPPSQQGEEQEARLIRLYNRLALYPIILMFCWTLPTINRIHNSVAPDDPHYGLYMAATITVRLQGCLNALVYGMNETVQSAWAAPLQAIGCHCCWWRPLNGGQSLGDGDEVSVNFGDEDDSTFIQQIDNGVQMHETIRSSMNTSGTSISSTSNNSHHNDDGKLSKKRFGSGSSSRSPMKNVSPMI